MRIAAQIHESLDVEAAHTAVYHYWGVFPLTKSLTEGNEMCRRCSKCLGPAIFGYHLILTLPLSHRNEKERRRKQNKADEHSDSFVGCTTRCRGSLVRASSEALCCDQDQDTVFQSRINPDITEKLLTGTT